MKPRFFKTPADLRKWFAANHDKRQELWVGFYKKASGKASIDWPQSVDEALCFGWIDGLRKSIDDERYMIRFTPRKPTSHWSEVNIQRLKELTKQGLIQPSGLAVFNHRKEERSRRASYEQASVQLDGDYEKKLKVNKKAWEFFQTLSPSVQKQCIWWIMSAKREATRQSRLQTLISSSANSEVIPPLRWTQKKKDR